MEQAELTTCISLSKRVRRKLQKAFGSREMYSRLDLEETAITAILLYKKDENENRPGNAIDRE